MKRDADGLPFVGTQSKELGVRVPTNENADVDLDSDGNVLLNGRGMSVASDWRYLQPHLIPRRLRAHHNGAAGPNSLAICRFGDGAFAASMITERLALNLKPGSTRHGNIVPTVPMPIEEFLNNLADTRDQWVIEEP